MQGNVKLELSETIDEIIPRLKKFPMQGKAIEAAIAANEKSLPEKKSKKRRAQNASESAR